MFSTDQYELIDFGNGRKLERFGPYVLDRPAPAAESSRPRRTDAWRNADARYDRPAGRKGRWFLNRKLPDRWNVRHGQLVFQLCLTPAGHLGLFPEHAANWDWITGRIRLADHPVRVLNLFAYTGATTLVAAACGAAVVHLDAARNVVAWARENARSSGLLEAPIRWIAEDVRKFVRRELRRENAYDAVFLDPPSYGHGPKSEAWKLDEHLQELLQDCVQLTRPRPAFLLLTCHTPGFGPRRIEACLREALRDMGGHFQAAELALRTGDGRSLSCGSVARWSPTPLPPDAGSPASSTSP